ncbi:hypothetical protein ACAW74_21675 [Fibrella sp. WM1]|uniref:hypothetical protein n=1 Tax=Fibrella musci TaxID=3242485 RepID=UPI00352008B0
MIRLCSTLLLAFALFLSGCDHIQAPPIAPGNWQTLRTFTETPLFLVTVNGQLFAGLASSDPADGGGFKRLVSFDPVTGSLTEKAPFPGVAIRSFYYFVLNNKLYAGLGVSPETNTTNATIELYNPDSYVYDPTANSWQQISRPPFDTGVDHLPRLAGATAFTYGNKGVLLYGTYRYQSLNSATIPLDGAAYTEAAGWATNTTTLYPTPVFPEPNSGQAQLFIRSVYRRGGFGFALNDRIYTGGGDLPPSLTPVGLPANTFSRVMWGFTVTEKANGSALNLTLQEKLETPSDDINLSLASQALVVANKAYIIGNGGSLIRFVPNEFTKISNVPEALRFGTGLNGKAYFLSQNKLLVYQPD